MWLWRQADDGQDLRLKREGQLGQQHTEHQKLISSKWLILIHLLGTMCNCLRGVAAKGPGSEGLEPVHSDRSQIFQASPF